MIHIFQLSFIIFAIWYTMQDGEIFGALGNLFSKLPVVFHNPLYDCPVCMVPWYGLPITIFLFHVYDPLQIILIIIPAMGLNVVLLKLAPDKDSPGYHEELKKIADWQKAAVTQQQWRWSKIELEKCPGIDAEEPLDTSPLKGFSFTLNLTKAQTEYVKKVLSGNTTKHKGAGRKV